MAKAQAAIEERKKALSNLSGQPPAQPVVPVVAQPQPPSGNVNNRIAELQARIRSQMGAVAGLPVPPVAMAPGLVTAPVVASGILFLNVYLSVLILFMLCYFIDCSCIGPVYFYVNT